MSKAAFYVSKGEYMFNTVKLDEVADMHRLLSKGTGDTYRSSCGGYLEMFSSIHSAIESGINVQLANVPPSWVALVRYMGASVVCTKPFFQEDANVNVPIVTQLSRHFVSVMSSHRPETLLYLTVLDLEGFISYPVTGDMNVNPAPVTCAGDLMTPDLISILADLTNGLHNGDFSDYENVILVPHVQPPYPSKLHTAVMEAVKEGVREAEEQAGGKFKGSWKLVEVSSALGAMPDRLWGKMPKFEEGISNEWRIIQFLRLFLKSVQPEAVISFCDTANLAIEEAALTTHVKVRFVSGYVSAYELDLLEETRLNDLRKCIARSTEAAIILSLIGDFK